VLIVLRHGLRTYSRLQNISETSKFAYFRLYLVNFSNCSEVLTSKYFKQAPLLLVFAQQHWSQACRILTPALNDRTVETQAGSLARDLAICANAAVGAEHATADSDLQNIGCSKTSADLA